MSQLRSTAEGKAIVGMSTLLPQQPKITEAANSMLKEMSGLLRESDVCRIVFRQCDALSLIQELLSYTLLKVSLIFETIESACLDQLTLEQIVVSNGTLEQIICKVQESLLLSATCLPAVATLLHRLVKDQDGKEKVVTVFRRLFPSLLAEIIQIVCSPRIKSSAKEEVSRFLTELFTSAEARKLLTRHTDSFRSLVSFAAEVYRGALHQIGSATLFEQITRLLSSLSNDSSLRKQLSSTSQFMGLPVQCMQHFLIINDQENLYATVALFANCQVDNTEEWVAVDDVQVAVKHLVDVISSEKCGQQVKSAALAALSRLSLHEFALQELSTDKTVQEIANLLKSTCLSSKNQAQDAEIRIQHSISIIYAHLITHHSKSIPGLVHHGIIELGRQLLTKHDNTKTTGNILLAFSNIAKDPEYRRLLSDDTLLLNLLKIACSNTGLVSKNAAICLARLSQDSKTLDFIRHHHGIEILHSALNDASRI